MQQFAVVVKELRTFLTSFKLVNRIMSYHLHIMFGGLIILFLYDLLVRTDMSFKTINLLFNDIPLLIIGYYGFFIGLWLTLISKDVKYLPYGLWGYAFLQLFPFDYMMLGDFVRAAIYGAAGYAVFRYTATSISESDTKSLNV